MLEGDPQIDCPSSAEALFELCPRGFKLWSAPSSSGGTCVQGFIGAQDFYWTFDASGILIGTLVIGDVNDCNYWGTTCNVEDPTVDLCVSIAGMGGASGAGGAEPG